MIDEYFRFPLLFLRLGGIPIKVQSVSAVIHIYNAGLMLCFYITFFAVIMDYVHIIKDIQESMKNVRLISAMAVNVWLHPYLR